MIFYFFQDESVIKLTQELAQKLGLKIRKAYVRAKVRFGFHSQIVTVLTKMLSFSLDISFVANEGVFSLQPPSNSVSSDISTQVSFDTLLSIS